MAQQSKAERAFRAKYPNTEVREATGGRPALAVYAGEYLCAEGYTRAEAFELALQYEADGLITPEPSELTASQRGFSRLPSGWEA